MAFFVDKCPLRHRMSTKGTLSVDKCLPAAPDVHKTHLLCGQATAIPRLRPQNTTRLWTKAPPKYWPFTNGTLSVDKCLPAAPAVHKRHPFRGQATAIHRLRPQNTTRLWTKAPSWHRMSTKRTRCVDRRPQFIYQTFGSSGRVHQLPPHPT